MSTEFVFTAAEDTLTTAWVAALAYIVWCLAYRLVSGGWRESHDSKERS